MAYRIEAMKISKISKLLTIRCYFVEDSRLLKNINMLRLKDAFFRENIKDVVLETCD